MLYKNPNGVYQFTELLALPWLVHGFSSVAHGNMRDRSTKKNVKDISTLAEKLTIPLRNLIGMGQVHGSHITTVLAKDRTKIIPGTDGLFSSDLNIFLYGTFADCLPILILDSGERNIGLVHAGRKGLLHHIVEDMIDEFIAHDSSRENISAFIGPSIRSCCYDITQEQADLFVRTFSQSELFLYRREGKFFLDLQKLTALQLQKKGIAADHITDCGICVKDHSGDFFSYRGQNKQANFWVNAAIIGMVDYE